jgi:hydrogenase expression/formation protein HypD
MTDPFRSKDLVRELTGALANAARDLPPTKIMHVCGTHEHEIGRHALRQLLPKNVELIAGPGCPVCITPASAIATAIHLALLPERPIVCTYGDIVRVPIAGGDLWQTRAQGADVRLVYGPREAVRLAQDNADRPVVFFSVGFETTAAGVAGLLTTPLPDNFFIYCCHRWVPAAVEVLAAQKESAIDGFLLPGHACVITGSRAYDFLPQRFGLPAAVAGFEPVDILSALLSLARQIQQQQPSVANCYPRVVRPEGNRRALEFIDRVFARTDAAWRGIGVLPATGLELRDEFVRFDALRRFGAEPQTAPDILPGCRCHLVMLGRSRPADCALFGSTCTPQNPYGPCMVGSEGTCRAHYLYPENIDE